MPHAITIKSRVDTIIVAKGRTYEIVSTETEDQQVEQVMDEHRQKVSHALNRVVRALSSGR